MCYENRKKNHNEIQIKNMLKKTKNTPFQYINLKSKNNNDHI